MMLNVLKMKLMSFLSSFISHRPSDAFNAFIYQLEIFLITFDRAKKKKKISRNNKFITNIKQNKVYAPFHISDGISYKIYKM